MTKKIFPPVPKPKNKQLFPDVKKRQTKTEFRQSLRKALFTLYAAVPGHKAALRELIAKFAGFLAPNDLTFLPYISENGKAKQGKINDCIAALISWVVQQGWRFQQDEISAEEAYVALDKLEQVAAMGLKKCKVVGDAKGFYLEIAG